MDESYKVAITRLGNRIRVGGTAEVSGYSTSLHPGAPRYARSFADRPVSARRRSLRRQILVRPAPDDAGRPADHRRHPLRQPASQYRPRHARLDHGLRLGARARRSCCRAASPTSTRASLRSAATTIASAEAISSPFAPHALSGARSTFTRLDPPAQWRADRCCAKLTSPRHGFRKKGRSWRARPERTFGGAVDMLREDHHESGSSAARRPCGQCRR